MKWIAGVFAAVLTNFIPVALHAQTIHSVTIGGAGREPCSAWTNDRKAKSDAGRASSQRRIEWVYGFFSAVNLFTESSGNLHGGIDDHDGMIRWLDNYCRAHPDDPLFAASGDLALNLRNQSASPKS